MSGDEHSGRLSCLSRMTLASLKQTRHWRCRLRRGCRRSRRHRELAVSSSVAVIGWHGTASLKTAVAAQAAQTKR